MSTAYEYATAFPTSRGSAHAAAADYAPQFAPPPPNYHHYHHRIPPVGGGDDYYACSPALPQSHPGDGAAGARMRPPPPQPMHGGGGRSMADVDAGGAPVPLAMIDPHDPMLDADPFGLSASMHFPTAYSLDQVVQR